MLKEILLELYDRDLNKLRDEINQFADEADLWKTADGITNSAGNLCQHIAGNLQHFFGATIGGTDYVRDRDAEFESKTSTREALLADIEAARASVRTTLEKLADQDFAKTYPIDVLGKEMTIGSLFTHLTTHLNYHLGQINYHRRLLT